MIGSSDDRGDAHHASGQRNIHEPIVAARVIRIVIADDLQLMREGLRALVKSERGLRLVGEAVDGRDAVRRVLKLKPDVALLDSNMPDMDGIEAARQILEAWPAARVIILAVRPETVSIKHAFQAGALGYVVKEGPSATVLQAIRAVHLGGRFIGPRTSDSIIEDFLHTGTASERVGHLSRREGQILQQIARGKTSAQIAQALSISVKTVETYRSRMMQKLGVHKLSELLQLTFQMGMNEPE